MGLPFAATAYGLRRFGSLRFGARFARPCAATALRAASAWSSAASQPHPSASLGLRSESCGAALAASERAQQSCANISTHIYTR